MYNQNNPQSIESESAPTLQTTPVNPVPAFIPGQDVVTQPQRRPNIIPLMVPLTILTILANIWYVYGTLSCGASAGCDRWGWINLLMVLPLQAIGFIICLFLFAKGIGKAYRYLGYSKKKTGLLGVLWVLLVIGAIFVPLPYDLNFTLQALTTIIATVVVLRQLKRRP